MTNLERQEIVNRLSAIDTSKLPPDGGNEYNRLIFEKSPYLLQHATNPVDWYPWGEEAFDKARTEDKPVMVSIGYSTCHWCHVMEDESFQDPAVGEALRRHVVSVKVDREERPDVDNTYMAATQLLTGTGGWPLNVFLTPDKKPFFAATYMPRENQNGRAGIIEVIERIGNLWKDKRQDLLQTCDKVTSSLTKLAETVDEPDQTALGEAPLLDSYNYFFETFDKDRGGFGEAPKFPIPHNILLLLRIWQRSGLENAHAMALRTLQHIRLGGVYDHIGFGVHRYAVDRFWRVPHFEKMLYDQALLILASLETFQSSNDGFFRSMAEEIIEYVLRDLSQENGAFCSGEDADTEGGEGTFYLWTFQQLQEVLGVEHGTVFGHCYEASWEGNFDGTNILRLEMDVNQWAAYFGIESQALNDVLALGRQKLFAARQQRIRPHRDDMVLTGWNGLAIAALARGAATLDNSLYLERAAGAADFILDRMRDDGRLRRRYRQGEAAVPGFLVDYAFFCWGLIELYQASFETRYLRAALDLTRQMESLFGDEKGHFFDTAEDAEKVLVRNRTILDGAIPAGNSAAAYNLLRLGCLTGNRSMEKRGEEILKASLPLADRYPTKTSLLRTALDFSLGPQQMVVLAPGENTEELEAMLIALRSRFLPRTLILKNGPGAEDLAEYAPLVAGKTAKDGRTTAYLCHGQTCLPPVQSVEELVGLLEKE